MNDEEFDELPLMDAARNKTEDLDDTYIFSFGKYSGASLGAVPASYLIWLFEQNWFARKYPGLNCYIEKNLRLLKKEAAGEPGYEDEDDWGDHFMHWKD